MDILDSSIGIFEDNEINKELESLFYDNRVIIIDTEINTSILRDVSLHIIQWNKEDKYIPADKRTPIKLIIDSDGGNVVCANSLINVIQSSVTPVYGIAFAAAASAATYILIACNKRYAFEHSVILLHDGTQGVYSTANKAKDTMRFFDKLDGITKDLIVDRTNIDSEEYEANKDREQYMFAKEAKEKGIIDYIINVDVNLDDIF